MKYSFYGGQQGKSFLISAIFLNKSELEADLNKRWSSPIGQGEFVFISYGLPDINLDEPYFDERSKEDLEKYGRTYNTTLWQKIYLEEDAVKDVWNDNDPNNFELIFPDNATYGIAYKLIAAMTGNTPVLQIGETETLPTNQDPYVTLDMTNMEKPILIFHLPKAARFIYGSGILGSRSAGSYVISLTEEVKAYNLETGDYYIDEPTGFIYEVIDITESDVTFKYLACLQAPPPEATVKPVDPYNADGSAKTPISIASTYTDEVERTGWGLEFSMPQIPNPAVTVRSVAPDDEPTASVRPINKNTINFNFNIPRGSRFFAGTTVDTAGSSIPVTDTIDNEDGTSTTITAQNGDMYLNTETGDIFILRQGLWMKHKSNLKGPKGDSLNTVLSLHFDSTEYSNVDTNGSVLNQPIEDAFIAEFDRMPKEDELIAVTWTDKDNQKDISYWYFYSETSAGIKQWDRATLTGNLSSLFFNKYTEGTGSSEKGYTAQYINGLIGGNFEPEDYDIKAFSVEQVLQMLEWGDMTKADTDKYPPEPTGDHDTLSAEELLTLISWGDMITLTSTNP